MLLRNLDKRFLQLRILSMNMTSNESHLICYSHRRICIISLVITACTFLFLTIPRFGPKNPILFSTDNLHLPVSLRCPHTNRTRLEHGRIHFAKNRVIICGLLRDREEHISRIRRQIQEITQLFSDYAIVIVENDSKDRTRSELIRWARDPKVAGRVHVLGCDNRVNDERPCNLSLAATRPKAGPETKRIEKMVRLRNVYMQYIQDNAQLSKFEYVIVQDFDLWAYTYADGLFSSGFHLSTDSTIDAICANGVLYNVRLGGLLSYTTYFDPYAHKDEQNRDWSTRYNEYWSTLFRKYPCNKYLTPVISCFSGQTIYRYESIKSKRYRTYFDTHQESICEHVGLHETLKKMYLNSEMIFYVMKNNLQ